LRPHLQAFSGYEIYSERDPAAGPEFNHGYLVGVSGTWHIFDGFATKGRMQATRARRDAAVAALEATRRSVASEVRSAFLDLEQGENVLQTETKRSRRQISPPAWEPSSIFCRRQPMSREHERRA